MVEFSYPSEAYGASQRR